MVFWLVVSNAQQDRKLAIIETKLDSMKATLELFLKNEMDALKEIIAKNGK